jgi:hypothetical protein
MSIAGILSSALFSSNPRSLQSKANNFGQEFRQLGQDLQSGNLSAAQTDLSALQQLGPPANSISASQSNSPIAPAFNQLSQDLKAGNTSAAQQDYATIQQDFKNQATQGHHSHHHGGGGAAAMKSVSCLTNWARSCNPGTSLVRSRHTAHCSRPSSSFKATRCRVSRPRKAAPMASR